MKYLDIVLRLEWVAVAIASIVFYAMLGGSGLLFAVFILAPDLSMLGYLAGPKAGALCYNAVHNLIAPIVLVLAGIWTGNALALGLGLIWIAHIAVDRALGYGLKLSSGFQDTHLGRIGRKG